MQIIAPTLYDHYAHREEARRADAAIPKDDQRISLSLSGPLFNIFHLIYYFVKFANFFVIVFMMYDGLMAIN